MASDLEVLAQLGSFSALRETQGSKFSKPRNESVLCSGWLLLRGLKAGYGPSPSTLPLEGQYMVKTCRTSNRPSNSMLGSKLIWSKTCCTGTASYKGEHAHNSVSDDDNDDDDFLFADADDDDHVFLRGKTRLAW